MAHSLARILAAALVAAAPLAAFADGAGLEKQPHATEQPTPRSAERAECVPSGELAQLASVQGDVRAIAPDGGARALDCDAVVNACETIETGPGASAGLLFDDAVVQIGPDARVALSARPGPDLSIERGAVRVIDAREAAPQRVQLHTPELQASVGRGDAELARSAAGVRACAHDEPLVVMAADGARTVASGSCLETQVAGAFATVPAGAPGVAIGDPASCPFRVAGYPALLPPVGTAPDAGPSIDPFDPPGRDSCDDPGSGCLSKIFDDPDPGTGCGFPGSPCPE